MYSCSFFVFVKACYNHSMSQTLASYTLPSGQELDLAQGDITAENVDVIVNAANSALQHGGGVAAAISRVGGPTIQAESNAWIHQHGLVSHAEPAYTTGGRMSCRYVIHAVGPVWGQDDDDAKLAAAVTGSLRRADQLGLKSIALPAISTGIFGFPKERAAHIFLNAIESYFGENVTSSLERVRIVLLDQPTLDAFAQAWQHWLEAHQA
jgi:O-acetyl-ADP-ribose deacetylase (regulator of RNase III)